MGNTDDTAKPLLAEHRPVAAYLAQVASSEPTPGGGSVVAVVAALGAALGAMVAHLTLGRPADVSTESELREHLAGLDALRGRLLPLAAADEAAYRGYRDAAALPKTDEPERAARAAALQTALLAATDVPLAVAAATVELAETLEPIARLGNRHALSDATIAAWLADAALRGALLNVRGNAALLRDAETAARVLRQADRLEAEGASAAARTLAAAAGRAS